MCLLFRFCTISFAIVCFPCFVVVYGVYIPVYFNLTFLFNRDYFIVQTYLYRSIITFTVIDSLEEMVLSVNLFFKNQLIEHPKCPAKIN